MKLRIFIVLASLAVLVGVAESQTATTNWHDLKDLSKLDGASLLKLANEGDANAQYLTGLNYLNGNFGFTKDDGQAAAWFRKAAEQGQVTAQGNLALFYRVGRGVPQDYAKSLAWYQRAAEQGDAPAQNSVGTFYFQGLGVAKDYLAAMAWFRKAADQGLAGAEANVAALYKNGWGVPQDYAQARAWYQRAADHGDADAKGQLAALPQTERPRTDVTTGIQPVSESASRASDILDLLRQSRTRTTMHFQTGSIVTDFWIEEPELSNCILSYKPKALNNGEASPPFDVGYGSGIAKLALNKVGRLDVWQFHNDLITPDEWYVRIFPSEGNRFPWDGGQGYVAFAFPTAGLAEQSIAALKREVADCAGVSVKEPVIETTADPAREQADKERVEGAFAQWRQQSQAPLSRSEAADRPKKTIETCLDRPNVPRVVQAQACWDLAPLNGNDGTGSDHGRALIFRACELGSDGACEALAKWAYLELKDIPLSRTLYDRCASLNGHEKDSCTYDLYTSYRDYAPRNAEKLGHAARAVCDSGETPPDQRDAACRLAESSGFKAATVDTAASHQDPGALLASLRAHADGPLSPEEDAAIKEQSDPAYLFGGKQLCDGKSKRIVKGFPINPTQQMGCDALGEGFKNKATAVSSASYLTKACQLDSHEARFCTSAAKAVRQLGNIPAARQLLATCNLTDCYDALSHSYESEEPRDLAKAQDYAKRACETTPGWNGGGSGMVDIYCQRAQSLGATVDTQAQKARVRQESVEAANRAAAEDAAYEGRMRASDEKMQRMRDLTNALTDNGNLLSETTNQQVAAIRAIGDAKAAQQQQAAQARVTAQQAADQARLRPQQQIKDAQKAAQEAAQQQVQPAQRAVTVTEGELIRSSNSPDVYLIQGGQRHFVPDKATLSSKWGGGMVYTVPQSTVDGIPLGNPIPSVGSNGDGNFCSAAASPQQPPTHKDGNWGEWQFLGNTGVAVSVSRVNSKTLTWEFFNGRPDNITSFYFNYSYIDADTGQQTTQKDQVPLTLKPGGALGGWTAYTANTRGSINIVITQMSCQ